jgi:DinB superfamily
MSNATAPQRIRDLGESIAAVIEGLGDEAFHARATPEGWSAAEVTGHASEFPVTFATQAVALARTPGLRLGRTLTDPGRLAAAARLGDATPQQAATIVRDSAVESARLVETIPADGWDAVGIRVMNGERFAVREVVEELIIRHLEGHLAQIRGLLPKA